MKRRSVLAVILLSLITCGIYGAYWIYVVSSDLQRVSGTSKIPPVLTLLLFIFFTPAGGALLGWDCSESVSTIRSQHGLYPKDNSVLWIVFGILMPIVTIALIQHEINGLLSGN